MRSISPTWFYLAAAALGAAGALPFADFDGALVFDPDLRVDDLLVYHAFFGSWSPGLLTPPSPNVYFEGHSLIYGLALHFYKAVAGLFGVTPSLREAAIATVSIVGALAHIAATMVFFATARRLTQNLVAALALVLLFGLSPQILAIDLIRIDRLMILPLMVVLHVSVLITRGEAAARHGVALGIAMAVLASTKISGALFGVLPVLAAGIMLLLDRRAAWPRVRTMALAAVTAGVPVLLLMMIRHVLHWERFIPSLAEGYAMQMKWTSVLPSTPLFYYNVDLFAGYGTVFLALVAASVVVLAVRTMADREATSLWLLISLVMFSAAGIAVFKYDRGGYHLVPLYLFALAIAVRHVMDIFAGRVSGRRALGELTAAAVVLVIPVAAVGETYANRTAEARLREASAIHTRMDSRDWILARFAPGDRICMMTSSQWANPPLAGRGLQVTTAPFDIPYLDGAAMADYMAPRLYQVRAACDAVVLNDLHNTVYLNNFTTRGYADRRAEWDRLLTDLRTVHPPKIFDGGVKAFFVSKVEVFDLRQSATESLPSRAEILAGTFDGAAFTFAGKQIPVEAGRFAGAVDASARYGADLAGVEGWAVDTRRRQPAAGIVLVADGKIIGFGGTGTIRRGDVAAAFENPDYQLAGVAACASSPAARLRVFALGQDGSAGELTPADGVAVVAAPAGAQAPYPCRSFEGP
jgi:hypothetical protein